MSNPTEKKYSQRFINFLRAFGVKGLEEYKTFNANEKTICLREYARYLQSFNSFMYKKKWQESIQN